MTDDVHCGTIIVIRWQYRKVVQDNVIGSASPCDWVGEMYE